MDCNCTVAEHGFGARRGDGDVVAFLFEDHVTVFVFLDIGVGCAVCERIFEVPHVTVDFEVFDLQVGDGGFKMRVPVDEAFAAIDQAVLVHFDKDFDDRVMEVAFLAFRGVRGAGHGEGVAGPVAGGAEAFQLFDDGAAGFLFPFPDLGRERFAAHFAAGWLLGLGEVAFDDHLGGDARVVLAWLPEGVVTLHAVPADQNVLQRVVEGVAHVENAGDVRGRDHDRKGFCAVFGVGPGFERARAFPSLVQAGFGVVCVECFFHRHGGNLVLRVSLALLTWVRGEEKA